MDKLEKIFSVLVGVVTLTGTVTASIHYVRRMHAATLMSQSQSMRSLTLVIRNDINGKPVSKAKVSVIVDAAVPLTRQVDSEGILSVDIPSTTKEAHVTVSAPGYITYDRQIPLWTAKFEDIRLTPSPKHVSTQGRQEAPANAPVSSPAAVGGNSPQIISAPGGIAIGGGTVTNPQVNNIYGVPAPPPRGSWTTRKLDPFAERVQQDGGSFITVKHPRVELDISLKEQFVHPIIIVKCSVPCTDGGLNVENPQINFTDSQFSGYGDVLKNVVKEPTAFAAGSLIRYTVISQAESDVSVLAVQLSTYP